MSMAMGRAGGRGAPRPLNKSGGRMGGRPPAAPPTLDTTLPGIGTPMKANPTAGGGWSASGMSASANPTSSQSASAFALGGAVDDDNDADQETGQDNQQEAANIPAIPAGPGGDQTNPNPFPTKTPAIPFGRRADNGAIPEGGATDPTTMDMSSALQTVDQIIQHGYQISGLTSGQSQQDQGAIPDGGTQAMADGGPIQPISGQLPPLQDEHAMQLNQINTDATKRAVANTTKQSSGTQRYDGGGAIPDGQPAPPQGQPDMSNGGPQTGGQPPQMQRLVGMLEGTDAMPIPQAQQIEKQTGETDPNVAKIKAIASLAQSQGPSAAWAYLQSLRKQYDFNRTNAAVKANQGNLAMSTEAATHAMTNVPDGTAAHFAPMPDGKNVRVIISKLGGGQPQQQQTQGYDDGGTVQDANGNDDSPAIPETPQGGAQPNTPAADTNDAAFNSVVGNVGKTIYDGVMSVPQYLNFLMGKSGQYDQVLNKGPVGAVTAALKPDQNASNATAYAQSVSGAVNTASPEEMMPGAAARLIGAAKGAIKSGINTMLNPGGGTSNDNANPYAATGPQSEAAPAPPAASGPGATSATGVQPWKNPAIGGTFQPKGPQGQPQGVTPSNETDWDPNSYGMPTMDQLAKHYGKDIVMEARARFPSVGQTPQMMDYLNEQAGTKRANEAKLAQTQAIWGNRKEIATGNQQTRLQVAQTAALWHEKDTAAQVSGMLQRAALVSGSAQARNVATLAENFRTANPGADLPPDLANAATHILNDYMATQGGGGQGPIQIQTQGNPNASQPQQQQTVYVDNKPHFVDASGKILGPAR